MKLIAEGPMHYMEFIRSSLESEGIHCMIKDSGSRLDSALMPPPGPMELSRLFVSDEQHLRAQAIVNDIQTTIENTVAEEQDQNDHKAWYKLPHQRRKKAKAVITDEKKWNWSQSNSSPKRTTSDQIMVGLASAIGVALSRQFGIVMLLPSISTLIYFLILKKWFNKKSVALFQVAIALVWGQDTWMAIGIVIMQASMHEMAIIFLIGEILITIGLTIVLIFSPRLIAAILLAGL